MIQIPVQAFMWMRPPWRGKDDYEGWPWCGDHFLAAVPCVRNKGEPAEEMYWDYSILFWDESGLMEASSGETWGDWCESDIEWIAKIPVPEVLTA